MSWIFLSKDGRDEVMNAFAYGSRSAPVTEFNYEESFDPIVIRGILKHKLMKRCWNDNRDFYFVDTGYFGNGASGNLLTWKQYHRVVKNDIQHNDKIISRPADRWESFKIPIRPWKKSGRKILIAVPDEKPMKFYDIELESWLENTINEIKQHTDRPIEVRRRVKDLKQRMKESTLKEALDDDVFSLVTFNSNAATESILNGIPAFVLAPTHAAAPVSLKDLSQIETPYYPDRDKVYEWACHLAYGQFHISELKNGTAKRMLLENENIS